MKSSSQSLKASAKLEKKNVKLKVKNVGPITEGSTENNGFIEFPGITVFIGKQGSGKSTLAKLYSCLKWLEKALLTWLIKESELQLKELLDFHKIYNYFTKDSYVHYIGEYYELTIEKLELTAKPIKNISQIISATKNHSLVYPKVQYIPAERSFLASLNNLDIIAEFPPNLESFYRDYDNARRILEGEFSLPIDDASVYNNAESNQIYLKNNKYDITLDTASSGFQTLVPLLLVINLVVQNQKPSQRLGQVLNLAADLGKGFLLQNLLECYGLNTNGKTQNYEEDLTQTALDIYRLIFNAGVENTFIIEEIEQSLYPISQQRVLHKLSEYFNSCNCNLVLTTHSPYILAAINNLLQAGHLLQERSELAAEINKIIPQEQILMPSKIRAYELKDGKAHNLMDKDFGLISTEELDSLSDDISIRFGKLLMLGDNDSVCV